MAFTGLTIRGDFTKFVGLYGQQIKIQYYTQSGVPGSYDDDITISQSGTDLWTSGMIFGLTNATYGSAEALLLEQGKLLSDDVAIYLPGNVILSGARIKIGLGSPVDQTRQVIYPGVDSTPTVTYNNSFSKIYTRILNGGSFYGE